MISPWPRPALNCWLGGVAVARGPELAERLQRAKAVISEKRLEED